MMVSSSQRCKLLGRHLAISGENWWVATWPNLVKTAPLGNKVKFTASKAFSQVPLLPLSNTEIRDDNEDTALQMINCFGALFMTTISKWVQELVMQNACIFSKRVLAYTKRYNMCSTCVVPLLIWALS